MKIALPIALAATLVSSAALAQTTPTKPAPATPPATTAPAAPSTPAPNVTQGMPMTDQQAKAWIDKVVYSSDDKNVGEVAEIRRDSSGKVTEMFADIGGFLGLGETRVRLMPDQFTFGNDRVTLKLSSEQVKALPKAPK